MKAKIDALALNQRRSLNAQIEVLLEFALTHQGE